VCSVLFPVPPPRRSSRPSTSQMESPAAEDRFGLRLRARGPHAAARRGCRTLLLAGAALLVMALDLPGWAMVRFYYHQRTFDDCPLWKNKSDKFKLNDRVKLKWPVLRSFNGRGLFNEGGNVDVQFRYVTAEDLEEEERMDKIIEGGSYGRVVDIMLGQDWENRPEHIKRGNMRPGIIVDWEDPDVPVDIVEEYDLDLASEDEVAEKEEYFSPPPIYKPSSAVEAKRAKGKKGAKAAPKSSRPDAEVTALFKEQCDDSDMLTFEGLKKVSEIKELLGDEDLSEGELMEIWSAVSTDGKSDLVGFRKVIAKLDTMFEIVEDED